MQKSIFLFLTFFFLLSCVTIPDSENTTQNDTVITPSTGCVEGDCENGTGTYYYDNGNRYTGGWLGGYREGNGVLKFHIGDKYEGNFSQNLPSGQGKYTYADGTVEEGLFSENLFTGPIQLPDAGDNEKVQVSRVVEVKTSTCEIIVTDAGGLKMGDKLFVEIDGIMCALDVFYPMMTVSRCKMIGGTRGFITKVKKEMPVYKMSKGIKRGNDTFLFPNGNKYVGEYKGNLIHGKGEFTWTTGTRYSGEFKNGMRNGKGTLYYYAGEVYTGEFKNGYYEGYGRFVWPSGSVYEGGFRKGSKYGKGKYTYSTGAKYVGEWKDDKINGKGTYTFPSGSKYVGEWKNGNYHGQGTLYDPDGSIKNKGRWENDEFIGE